MPSDDNKLTAEKCKDSGLALVLISLLCYQAWKQPFFLDLAILLLLVVMTYPVLFRPFAHFWFGLSTLLGTVASKVLLSVLFYVLVLPVGLVRRALGKDSMRMKSWKKGKESVFRVREHRFAAEDLEHPY
jgi:multisubunit Na+/H+ antiporter MnhG subunit